MVIPRGAGLRLVWAFWVATAENLAAALLSAASNGEDDVVRLYDAFEAANLRLEGG